MQQQTIQKQKFINFPITRNLLLIFLLLSAFFIHSCRDDTPTDDDASIISFSFTKAGNPILDKDYRGIINQSENVITVDLDIDLANFLLYPEFITSTGSNTSIISGKKTDFTSPVQIRVTSVSGVEKTYTVTVNTSSQTPVISSITINNIICPVDKTTSSHFFSVTADDSGDKKIFCYGRNIENILIENTTIKNGNLAEVSKFKPGTTVSVTPVNTVGKQGLAVKLVLTSLPLVNISVAGSIVNEPKTVCYISLIDPYKKTNDEQFYFSPHRAGIEIRGGLSQTFPKKSFGIEFWQEKKDEEVEDGTKLFGLRNDGDWVLDAMYVDRARMRNRLSTDIWLDMNKVPYLVKEPKALNGVRGYFVELFINDAYSGLYCLTEKVDRKQLKLNDNEGFSYKASKWSYSTEFINANATFTNSNDTWDGWELEYQGLNYSNPQLGVKWEPLRDLILFTSTSSDDDFLKQIPNRFNLDNLVDYLLFTNFIGADDNTGKNCFFSFYSKPINQFFITPWDLDATWGRKWNGNLIYLYDGEFIGVTGVMRTDSRYCRPNLFFKRVVEKNPAGFKQKLKTRWPELKNELLLVSNISKRIQFYKTQLQSSGAYTREMERWPATTANADTETAYMISWAENRIKQIDKYIDSL